MSVYSLNHTGERIRMTDLQVIHSEWYLSSNKTNHHTDMFDSESLIIRRGKPFTITLTFTRPLNSGENIMLTCETGPSPSETSKTKALFPLFGNGNHNSWSSVLTSINSNVMTANITSPPDAVVGQYSLSVFSNPSSTQVIGGLYLLFNPWAQEDDVFLAEESEKQEYVLNEKGVIFVGREPDIIPVIWDYGQDLIVFNVNHEIKEVNDLFVKMGSKGNTKLIVINGMYELSELVLITPPNDDDIINVASPWDQRLTQWIVTYDGIFQPPHKEFERGILEICFAIMDRSISYQKDPLSDVAQRNDPLFVCRSLNATVNSKDENGVLVENWSGFYDDGISPTYWNGSSVILKEWYHKGYTPVKYGQCWVYGGLLCTVLRCLGIPTRVITNFNSAQDKNGNLFIDMTYDSHGISSESKQDLIWNFHVWNEAWFVRKDLGPSYNGWQVMDATPLEKSDGLYRCGPAPLVAIKEGDVDLKYDVGFMFASVNADLSHWIHYHDGTKKRISNDTKYIGKYISTKAVGSDDRVDVTHTYKYPEDSLKEREMFEKAINKLLESPFVELEKKLLHFRKRGEEKPKYGTILAGTFTVTQTPTLGQDLSVILSLKNLSTYIIKVILNMTASSILYTGKHKHEIWADAKYLPMGPNEEKHISVPMTYAQYGKYVSADNMIRMTVLCEVDGTEERILVEKDINLEKPPISIKLPDQVVINKAFNAEVVITNTLSDMLNSCSLLVEGSGLIDGSVKKDLPPLKPGEKSYINFTIIPFKSGNRTLITTFSCDKIKNVKSSHKVVVARAP